jgi:hypothetical protein
MGHEWRFVAGRFEAMDTAMIAGDWIEALSGLGFNSYAEFSLGTEEEGLQAEVYAASAGREGVAYDYLVAVSVGSAVDAIFVAQLPDLLELLGRIAPIIQSAMDTSRRERIRHAA